VGFGLAGKGRFIGLCYQSAGFAGFSGGCNYSAIFSQISACMRLRRIDCRAAHCSRSSYASHASFTEDQTSDIFSGMS